MTSMPSIPLTLIALLPGGHGQPIVSATPSASITNLHVAGAGLVAGERAVFGVREDQEGQDLNGDEDQQDSILHVRELASGKTWNLGLATPLPNSQGVVLASDRLLVAPVEEDLEDLNGDGDRLDFVLHVVDLGLRRVTNLGLAGVESLVSDDQVAFLVGEAGQGHLDLNGDGDTLDAVMHCYSPARGVQNLGLAVPSFPVVPRPVVFRLEGQLLAFLVSEPSQGGLDLNGDGDAVDSVLFAYDESDGIVRDLRLATGEGVFAENPFAVSDPWIVFGVAEPSQGGDLNGDGDKLDLVAHAYRSDTGTIRNLGLATPGRGPYRAGRGFVAFLVHEQLQGNVDLNGDSDTFDLVVFVYDGPSDTARNLHLAALRFDFGTSQTVLEAGGRRLAFHVGEETQGRRDRNGDFDLNDFVLHVYDADMESVENLHLAAADAKVSADHVAFRVLEASQGNHDLTGDGDTNDGVLFLHDLRTHETRGSGAQAEQKYELAQDACLFQSDERHDFFGDDLNGDGDTGDRILRVFGWASGRVLDLGLALGAFSDPARSFTAHRHVLFNVGEEAQAASDLNGDGDILDSVLHVARIDELTRLR